MIDVLNQALRVNAKSGACRAMSGNNADEHAPPFFRFCRLLRRFPPLREKFIPFLVCVDFMALVYARRVGLGLS
jgi:hypothetical protein